MREYIKPAKLGWHLSDELVDSRSLKDKNAGAPRKLCAEFRFGVQREGEPVNFNQQCQYPGTVAYTREQLRRGDADIQGVPKSLQSAALKKFDLALAYKPAAESAVILQMPQRNEQAPVSKQPDLRHQMAAQVFKR